MVVDTSDKNQFSYFYVLNLFLKLTRPYPTRQWMLFDGVYILYIYAVKEHPLSGRVHKYVYNMYIVLLEGLLSFLMPCIC